MGSDLVFVLPVLAGVVLVAVTSIAVTGRAADGRIPPNSTGGIRTRHTRASAAAWQAGHAAARPVIALTGWLAAATVVLTVAGAVGIGGEAWVLVGLGGIAAQLVVVVRAAVVANRAARAAGPPQG